uniref:ATP-dependent DNA helicase homolog RECGic isoform X2 n=1 Tax=Rhizophora mucronata TaxID=61149 RepID=A0A2P2LYJ4_RHIMU
MALTLSLIESCGLCCSGKQLKCGIAFEAERGYQNHLGRKMRFNNVLLKILTLCSRSKHKFADKLLEEVNDYGVTSISNQSKLLNRVNICACDVCMSAVSICFACMGENRGCWLFVIYLSSFFEYISCHEELSKKMYAM